MASREVLASFTAYFLACLMKIETPLPRLANGPRDSLNNHPQAPILPVCSWEAMGSHREHLLVGEALTMPRKSFLPTMSQSQSSTRSGEAVPRVSRSSSTSSQCGKRVFLIV